MATKTHAPALHRGGGGLACCLVAGWVILMVIAVGRPAVGGELQPQRYAAARQLASLENQDIQESSGLAVSHRVPGLLWTHNDSGDTARIFAFDRHGKHWGDLTVPGVEAVDWEDMASFVWHERPCLLLADVGDNPARRPRSVLYLVEEPEMTTAIPKRLQTLAFQYEDGPQNCEAVAVDPSAGVILLATKAALSSRIYQLPLSAEQPQAVLTARHLATLPLPLVTGMDISPDARRVVLVTYGHAYQYVRMPQETWQQALARRGAEIQLPPRRQGEAICYGTDSRTLYLTSEKAPTPLWCLEPAGQ